MMMFSSVSKKGLHTTLKHFKKVTPNDLKGKGTSSAHWLTRQLADPYVEKAKIMNYRCRSAFKLIEMDDRFKFLHSGQIVIDCGAAPGSWTQVAVKRVNGDGLKINEPIGRVIAIDKQQIYPIPGATILGNFDIALESTQEKIRDTLNNQKANVVLSDMAPNATGIREMDADNIVTLCYLVLRLAALVSEVNATLIVKLWQNASTSVVENDLKHFYKRVCIVKPTASRADSSELFLLARMFKGLKS